MKRQDILITTSIILLLATIKVSGQGLSIGSSTTFTLGSATLSLSGNWSNAGTFDAGSGTVIFNNSSGEQTITNSSGETFYNLTINKAADNLKLLNDITIDNTLTLSSGEVDLNGNYVYLNTGASLSETAGNTCCNGIVEAEEELNSPSSNNVCGLGLEITANIDLGSTNIKRGFTAQTSGGGNTGINRYFEVTPNNTSGLNADLVFHYDESELNDIDEADLKLFVSEDNGSTWNLAGGIADPANNKVSITGISSFSRWTLASSNAPLPVEITSFDGYNSNEGIMLTWQTATEVNNYGFEIERAILNSEFSILNWTKLGFVPGNGTTNSPKDYSFTDTNLPSTESVDYRLKQIDNDGTYNYSKFISVNLTNITDVEFEEMPTDYSLSQNYPNPFNPSTSIKFSLPKNGFVDLRVFNMLGQEVAQLVNNEMRAGYHQVNFDASSLSSGIYFYSIQISNGFVSTKKLMLMK